MYRFRSGGDLNTAGKLVRVDGSRGRGQRSGEGGRHANKGQEEALSQVLKKQEQVCICGEHGPGLGGTSRLRKLSDSLPIFP